MNVKCSIISGSWAVVLCLSSVAVLKAGCGDDASPSRRSLANADVVEYPTAYPELRAKYFQRLDGLISGSDAEAAGRAPEKADEMADKLLSEMIEDVPMVYLRAYLARAIQNAARPLEKKWRQRLFDRVNQLRAMDVDSARALIFDSARDRRLPTLLLCFGALPDPMMRAEAAKALADFKEVRVVRFLTKTVAALAGGAPYGGASVWLAHIELQNATIKSLSTLIGLDLATIGPPPHTMRNDETVKEFAARLVAARHEGTSRCEEAVKRGKQWLEEHKRHDTGSSE